MTLGKFSKGVFGPTRQTAKFKLKLDSVMILHIDGYVNVHRVVDRASVMYYGDMPPSLVAIYSVQNFDSGEVEHYSERELLEYAASYTELQMDDLMEL